MEVPIKTPRKGFLLNLIVSSLNSGKYFKGDIASDMSVRAKNIPPNPNNIRPTLLIFSFFVKNRQTTPINNMGSAYSEISNPIINVVIVVPIFAPIIIPIACLNVRSPAPTSPIVMTEVPELDWIKAVTNIPTRTPKKGEVVYLSRMCFNLSPAAICNPSPIYFIQNRNSPNPPKNIKAIC